MRALLFALLAVACGGLPSSPVVKTTSAEVSSIARYQTYSLANAENAPEQYARGAPKPEMVEKVWRHVDAEMRRKGYTPAADGEIVVRVSSGRRAIEEEPTGGSARLGAPGTTKTEGALVIDLLDRATGKLLFHGYAHDILRDGNVKEEQLQGAVSKILAEVPDRPR